MPNFILLWIYSRSIWLLTWLNVCNVICLPLCDVVNFEINILFWPKRQDNNGNNVIILKGLSVVRNCLRPDHEWAFKVRIYRYFLHNSFLNFHQLQVEHSIFWVQCTYSLHCTIYSQVYCFWPFEASKFDRRLVAQTIVMH